MSIVLGALAGAFTLVHARSRGAYFMAADFTVHWRAADAMLRGYSPYVVINGFSPVYPFAAGYLYMLPAAVLLMPFGLLEMQTAMALFVGISTAVFAFALTKDGWWRLPLIASAPSVGAMLGGQTVPLVTAAMLLPALGWLAPMKFTTGIAGAAYSLSRRYVLLALGIIVLTAIVWPWWPAQWWAERTDIVGAYYHVPVTVTGGAIVLLALLRWRRPEARLLVAMACLPQTMLYYDQLPLALIARNYREALAVAVLSYGAPLVAAWRYGIAPTDQAVLFSHIARVIVACYYLPALVCVMLRRNEAA